MRKLTQRQAQHTNAMSELRTFVYDTLRSYQKGEFDATSGVTAGQLGIELTVVNDQILKKVDELFAARGAKR